MKKHVLLTLAALILTSQSALAAATKAKFNPADPTFSGLAAHQMTKEKKSNCNLATASNRPFVNDQIRPSSTVAEAPAAKGNRISN